MKYTCVCNYIGVSMAFIPNIAGGGASFARMARTCRDSSNLEPLFPRTRIHQIIMFLLPNGVKKASFPRVAFPRQRGEGGGLRF